MEILCSWSPELRLADVGKSLPVPSWSPPAVPSVVLRAVRGRTRASATVFAVSVVQTLLVLAVLPAAIYGLISLIVLWPTFNRVRYRAGQAWDFAAVFWVANPASGPASALGKDEDRETVQNPLPDTARGGASGNW